jgi:ADP-ribose pyrophosphatase YjhB (NUDIX family)
METGKTATVSRDGTTSIIVNRRRALLLKRIWLPFMTAPGKWTFVMGGKKRAETYHECAIREIREETSITEDHLRLLHGPETVLMCERGGTVRWENKFFIFESDTDHVRLDIENRSYKWAGVEIFTGKASYYNLFADEKRIMHLLLGLLE